MYSCKQVHVYRNHEVFEHNVYHALSTCSLEVIILTWKQCNFIMFESHSWIGLSGGQWHREPLTQMCTFAVLDSPREGSLIDIIYVKVMLIKLNDWSFSQWVKWDSHNYKKHEKVCHWPQIRFSTLYLNIMCYVLHAILLLH